MAAPLAWLGVGAQRCGTTWFTDLLLQHPEMSLATDGRKELHQLYRSFSAPWGEGEDVAYARLFPEEGLCGEFTPYYLRAPWSADVAKRNLRPTAPVLVLLRDPVARFESAVRLYIQQGRFEPGGKRLDETRFVASDAIWGGLYAPQLAAWGRVVGRRRMIVLQYEQLKQDPGTGVQQVWKRLGLDPVPLQDVERPSRTTVSDVDWSMDSVPGLRESLRETYRPQLRQLRRWGIDTRLWTSLR